MKNLTSYLLLVFCTSCQQQTKNVEETETSTRSKYYWSITENYGDTVENGSFIRTKVYMESNELYTIAKKNGIEQYLNITFDDQVDEEGSPWEKAILEGDTGIVEFQLPNFDIPEGEAKEFVWTNMVAITYKSTTAKFDTAFIDSLRLFIVNKN
ncbi:MAG: hypothetical protein JXQ96_09975 [Cyclobacteriaceae bacterium]